MRRSVLIVLAFLFCATAAFALSQDLVNRLDYASAAFKELMDTPDQGVPQDLLKNCEAIAIFPRTLNIAWGLGGQYGKGVLLRHDKKRHDWSAPAFYNIGGLTIGPQIGGQAIDIVLVVMNEKGLNSLLESKCTLGGDAGIALGPVGRNATASTDLKLKAEIYSYSKAKGLYIGLSLKGAVVTADKGAIAELYGNDTAARDILLGRKGGIKPEAAKLLAEFRRHTPGYVPLKWMAFVWSVALVIGIFFIGRNLLIRRG